MLHYQGHFLFFHLIPNTWWYLNAWLKRNNLNSCMSKSICAEYWCWVDMTKFRLANPSQNKESKALVTNTLTNAVRTIFLPFTKWLTNRSYGVRKGICDHGLSRRNMTKETKEMLINVFSTRPYVLKRDRPREALKFLLCANQFWHHHLKWFVLCHAWPIHLVTGVKRKRINWIL